MRQPSSTFIRHGASASNVPPGEKTRLSTIVATCVLITAFALAIAPFAARPAWAAPATGSITIEGVEDSVDVTAYRIVEVNYDEETLAPDDPMFTWTSNVQSWVRLHFPSYIDDDGNVASGFNAALSDSGELIDRRPAGEAAAFYDALASAILSGEVSLDDEGARTGNGTIENLPLGGYLVLVDNGLKVYRPSATALVQSWDEKSSSWAAPETATITVKASEVPITKTVNDQGSSAAQIGDTLSFDIVAAVPVYPSEAHTTSYAICDTLPAGLTLKQETLEAFGVKGDEETQLENGTHFVFDENGHPGASFSMDFDYDLISSFESIHVVYEATLNGAAAVGPDGNVNTAHVEYANNPYDESSSIENPDEAKVITYGLEILKVGDDEAPLSGAEFSVSHAADGSNPLSFVQEAAGVYHLASQSESGTSTVSVAEDGTLKIKGLATGEYYITETKAPDGYLRLAAPFKAIVADEDCDGALDGASKTPGYAFLQIQNTHGFTLPVTGGMGTTAIIAAGIVLAVSGAAIWLAANRRAKEEKRR